MNPATAAGKINLTINISADELRFFSKEEKSVGALQCWLIQRQPSGADLTSKDSSFSFQLTAPELESAKSQGISLRYPVAVRPNADRIRIMLRDVNSGRIGTVDVPLTHEALP